MVANVVNVDSTTFCGLAFNHLFLLAIVRHRHGQKDDHVDENTAIWPPPKTRPIAAPPTVATRSSGELLQEQEEK
jgi:hypothetical protein